MPTPVPLRAWSTLLLLFCALFSAPIGSMAQVPDEADSECVLPCLRGAGRPAEARLRATDRLAPARAHEAPPGDAGDIGVAAPAPTHAPERPDSHASDPPPPRPAHPPAAPPLRVYDATAPPQTA